MQIQWYPGHMAKAKREMEQMLKLSDVVLEIVDARAPLATRNPELEKIFVQKPKVMVLNKEDLSNRAITQQWCAYWKEQGVWAVPFCAKRKASRGKLMEAMETAAAPLKQKWQEKGIQKMVRVMVTGIPNVGKSSIINTLSDTGKARTGATPGVTRGRQWVRLSDHLELLDTPGLLWPKLSDEAGAKRLAVVNAIRDEVLELEPLALWLIETLQQIAPGALQQRIPGALDSVSSLEILELLARKRGFLQKGGVVDTEKAAVVLIEEFRDGKIGRISLEKPGV